MFEPELGPEAWGPEAYGDYEAYGAWGLRPMWRMKPMEPGV